MTQGNGLAFALLLSSSMSLSSGCKSRSASIDLGKPEAGSEDKEAEFDELKRAILAESDARIKALEEEARRKAEVLQKQGSTNQAENQAALDELNKQIDALKAKNAELAKASNTSKTPAPAPAAGTVTTAKLFSVQFKYIDTSSGVQNKCLATYNAGPGQPQGITLPNS